MKKIVVFISFLLMLTICGKETEYELICKDGIIENNKCDEITGYLVETINNIGYYFNSKEGKEVGCA